MQKLGSFFVIILLLTSLLFLERCVKKDKSEYNPQYPDNKKANDSPTTVDLSTLPGNNYFNLTTGSVNLYSLSLTSASFKSVRGKCDTSAGRYVLSVQSADTNLAYSNIILKSKPVTSKILPLVAYEVEPLTENNAWAIITIIKDNKTWRAINGYVNIIADSNNVTASFDSVAVECISNITDTTYYKMSGTFFCK